MHDMEQIRAMQAAIEAEETERVQEWQASRTEGHGVTPGVSLSPADVQVLKDAGITTLAVVEPPEDLCDFVPTPELINPKQQAATRDKKAPLHLLEPVANEQIALVLQHGATKYGRRNFYETPILANVYTGAIQRHLDAFKDMQDLDPDTALSHIAHIGANVHVLLTAMKVGTFVDDRGPEKQSEVQRRLSEASNRSMP